MDTAQDGVQVVTRQLVQRIPHIVQVCGEWLRPPGNGRARRRVGVPMSYRSAVTTDDRVAALAQLRAADTILAGLPGAALLDTPLTHGIPPIQLGSSSYAEAGAARAVHVTREMWDARGSVRIAYRRMQGELWTGGIAEDGTRLNLSTPVGLRRAVREYFARIWRSDPQLAARVAPLDRG